MAPSVALHGCCSRYGYGWCGGALLLVAAAVGCARAHSSSPHTVGSLLREVSMAEVEAPLVSVSSSYAPTHNSNPPVSTATALASSAGSGVTDSSLAEMRSELHDSSLGSPPTGVASDSPLHRVSRAWITSSLAKMEKERYEEEIRRQVEQEDADWNQLEHQPQVNDAT